MSAGVQALPSRVLPPRAVSGRGAWQIGGHSDSPLGHLCLLNGGEAQHTPKRVLELGWGLVPITPTPPLCDPGQLTSLSEPQLPHLQNETGRHTLLSL